MKAVWPLVALTLFLASCERNINIPLQDVTPKLVVEATIENGTAPLVYLSKSQAYFSQLDATTLANSFVHNAEVYVSDGSVTHRLKEFTVPVSAGINVYYYSNDPADPVPGFTGQLNHSYSLRVVTEGEEYTAVTTIPGITKRIDSMYWKPAGGNAPANKVVLMLKLTDPPGFGDYTRYYTRQNSQPFYPGLTSVFDDQIVDNSTYEVPVERGVDRNADRGENYSFFDRGDTVTLKLSNIDKATFDFWRTMEFNYASVGNPFSTPTKVLGNISNGALGYFGGYASQYRTLIIPR